MRRRDDVPDDRAVLREWALRGVPRRFELPEHRAALQERRLRDLRARRKGRVTADDDRRGYDEGGGRRDRRELPGLRVLSPCFSLCLVQQSAQRHSTMKVPSAAALRERRHPNFGLISV